MKLLNGSKISLVLATLAVLAICSSVWAASPGWIVTQLTNNEYDDTMARASGSNVVWGGGEWGSGSEIFFYDGDTIRRLTDDNYFDAYPQLSGSNVVWEGRRGGGLEIFLYDGSTINQITNNSYADRYPHVSGLNVVWEGDARGINYEDIFIYDGNTITQLSDGSYRNKHPRVSGSNVVWMRSRGTWAEVDIFLYDGSTTTQIASNNGGNPRISGSNVAWLGWDGSDFEVYFYDGSTTTQLTDNNYFEQECIPEISASNVVWSGYDGSDYEIFFYDGSTITQITTNNYPDKNPQISGSNVVWQVWDGGDHEIFHYDGSTITQLTDNTYDDWRPQISGSNVVWYGWDGNDYEIFLAIIPEPAIEVTVDIKPRSCPNPLNVKSKGVLPVAILGSAALDVTTIDAGSIFLNGVPTIRSSLEDVAGFIADANDCECIALGPDGYLDLTLKFMTQDIVATIGEVNHDDVLELQLDGVLYDETPVEGADCVVIRGKHKPINKADINKDGVVNMLDVVMVADNWLESSVE